MGISILDPEPYHKHSINVKAQLRRLLSLVFPFVAFPPLALALVQLEKLARYECFRFLQFELLGLPGIAVATLGFLLLCGLHHYFWFTNRPVYLLDFACYRPPDASKLPMHEFMKKSEILGKFTEESLDFQKKNLQRSGIEPGFDNSGSKPHCPEWSRLPTVVAGDLHIHLLDLASTTLAAMVS